MDTDDIISEQQVYFEKKDIERNVNYTDKTIRKFLRLMGVTATDLLQLPGHGDKLEPYWFDQNFEDCPFRLAFLKTYQTISLQDFFWRPTKHILMDVYDENRDNYTDLCPSYDKQFHGLALIYYDRDNKKDIVFREHKDGLSEVTGYPRCIRPVANVTYVMEPLEGFCVALSKIWVPHCAGARNMG